MTNFRVSFLRVVHHASTITTLRILYRASALGILLLAFPAPSVAQEAVTTTGPDTAVERKAPKTLEVLEREQEQKLQPFGANLFKGGFQSERESGLNPDYLVVPGVL